MSAFDVIPSISQPCRCQQCRGSELHMSESMQTEPTVAVAVAMIKLAASADDVPYKQLHCGLQCN